MDNINRQIIFLSVLGGIAFWFFDALFDKFVLFPHIHFWNIFSKDAPTHPIYSRPIVIILFIIFSINISLILDKFKGNQNRYQKLFQSINDAILIKPALTYDGTGKFVEANEAACQMLGYTREQILQLSPRNIIDPDRVGDLPAYMGTLKSEGHAQLETVLLNKHGIKIPVEISAHMFQFKGEPLCLAVIRDISIQQEIEEALRTSEGQLQILTERVQKLQEEERGRLSRELHDELAQNLVFLKMEVSSIENTLPPELTGVKNKCRNLICLLEETSDSVSRLSQKLRPRGLEEKGFSLALYLLTKESCKIYGVKSCTINIDQIDNLLSSDAQLNLYRIFQESLTNIGKHADASDVVVTVKRQNGHVHNRIKDNGKGYDRIKALAQKRGCGLSTIEERTRLLGGRLKVQTDHGEGTEISLTIPLKDMASINEEQRI